MFESFRFAWLVFQMKRVGLLRTAVRNGTDRRGRDVDECPADERRGQAQAVEERAGHGRARAIRQRPCTTPGRRENAPSARMRISGSARTARAAAVECHGRVLATILRAASRRGSDRRRSPRWSTRGPRKAAARAPEARRRGSKVTQCERMELEHDTIRRGPARCRPLDLGPGDLGEKLERSIGQREAGLRKSERPEPWNADLGKAVRIDDRFGGHWDSFDDRLHSRTRTPSSGWAIVEAQLSSGRVGDCKMCSKSARVA